MSIGVFVPEDHAILHSKGMHRLQVLDSCGLRAADV